MNAALRALVVVALLLALVRPLPAQKDDSPEKADPEPVLLEALADLGHADFAKRNNAALALWKLGRPALPYLQKLADSTDDPETAHRASQLALRIDFGLAPGAPRELLQFLEEYEGANPDNRYGILYRRLRAGLSPVALEALIRLECRRDPTPKNDPLQAAVKALHPLIVKGEAKATSRVTWEAVVNFLENNYTGKNRTDALRAFFASQGSPPFGSDPHAENALVPRSPTLFALTDKGVPAALDFLRISFAAGDHRNPTIRRLALFEFLAGDPDKAISQTAARYAKTPSRQLASLLIYLHRLNGGLPKAAEYAADFPDTDAALATFADLGNWSSFRAGWLALPHPNLNAVEESGIKAALAQLVKDADSLPDALRNLTAQQPVSYSGRHQQLENLVLLGETKSALDVANRKLAGDPELGVIVLYNRWIMELLASAGQIDLAIANATPLVEKYPWRSSQLTSEFADLLISQNKKLPKSLTEGRGVPTTSIGSYFQTLKKAGLTKTLKDFDVQISRRSTFPRLRRYAEGHFPDAPKGHAAMWWFFLSKKFPTDSYEQRLARMASRLATFPKAEVPEGVKPTNPEVITEDLAAMFQHRGWLAIRCTTGKDSFELLESWLSLAVPFTKPGSALEEIVSSFATNPKLSPAIKLDLASYFIRHRSLDMAKTTLTTMAEASATPAVFAGLARLETDPDKATKILLRAHLTPLENPDSRGSLISAFTRFGQSGEAEKSRRILHALWSPSHDGFSPEFLFPEPAMQDPDEATKKLSAQREWLQHFTAKTFRPLTEPPPTLPR